MLTVLLKYKKYLHGFVYYLSKKSKYSMRVNRVICYRVNRRFLMRIDRSFQTYSYNKQLIIIIGLLRIPESQKQDSFICYFQQKGETKNNSILVRHDVC